MTKRSYMIGKNYQEKYESTLIEIEKLKQENKKLKAKLKIAKASVVRLKAKCLKGD